MAKDGSCSRRTKPQSIMGENLDISLKTNVSVFPSEVPLMQSSIAEYKKIPPPGESLRIAKRFGFMSQRHPVKIEEVDIVLLKAQAFKSERPFYLIQMRDSYVYYGFTLPIPMNFAREHFPQPRGNVILLDPSGTRWEVKSISCRQYSFFSAGWCKFSITNNLETGDVCVFEVIKKHELMVHIFRVVEKLTPLIRT